MIIEILMVIDADAVTRSSVLLTHGYNKLLSNKVQFSYLL